MITIEPSTSIAEDQEWYLLTSQGLDAAYLEDEPGYPLKSVKNQESDFSNNGLLRDSLIRLGFLAVLPRQKIIGSIGSISAERHNRLLKKLSEYLLKSF